MAWTTKTTVAFSKAVKKHRRDKQFLDALDKKLTKLQEAPHSVGGLLAGRLHGYRSTRILAKFRLIFKIVETERAVYLIAIDHRKFDYANFGDA